jgi:tetratricopeptide (TPR) repeat protein
MMQTRIFAGVFFLGFVFAAAGTLGLAISALASHPVGNATYYQTLAERQPELAGNALREALRLNPRASGAWIALGLEAEQAGDLKEAERCLLEAEKIDRQYLPAWTAANFFFRQADDPQFWQAAVHAAAMSYDDPAPLIALADRREPQAMPALERLGDSARLERGYLHFLIGESRWREARDVAARLISRRNPQDSELLLALVDRLIAAGEGDAAWAVWTGVRGVGPRGLTNGDFVTNPSGHGFDWRVTAPPGGSAHWDPARIQFRLTGSMPDTCGLLAQWIVLGRGRYRLKFFYQTQGLAPQTGLHWSLARLAGEAREQAVSLVLAQAPQGAAGGPRTEWIFEIVQAGLFDLRLIYDRVPGTTHQEGRAEFGSVALEIL